MVSLYFNPRPKFARLPLTAIFLEILGSTIHDSSGTFWRTSSWSFCYLRLLYSEQASHSSSSEVNLGNASHASSFRYHGGG